MKKAVLVNISDIGDIVSSSIILDALNTQGYDVSFVMPKFVHPLFQDQKVNLLAPDQNIKESFDLLIDLTSDKKSRKLVRTLKSRQKIGRIKDFWQKVRHWVTYTAMVPKKYDGHIVRDYYPILRKMGDDTNRLPHLDAETRFPSILQLSDSDKVVAIHFGAHNPKRVIPEYLITKVITELNDRGFKIVLLGTEDDIAQEIIKKNNNIPIYKKLSLLEVKQVLKTSKLFIGADSGILHIASALNVPSVGVYGPNVPRRSGPLSPSVTIIEQDLDCRPCNQNIECPYNVKCMMTLDSQMFLDHVLKRLNGN